MITYNCVTVSHTDRWKVGILDLDYMKTVRPSPPWTTYQSIGLASPPARNQKQLRLDSSHVCASRQKAPTLYTPQDYAFFCVS